MKIHYKHHKPERKKKGDAGLDLPIHGSYELLPFKPVALPTGVYVAIPEGWVGEVRERSSAHDHKVMKLAGTVDSGYRGEVRVVLMYYGETSLIIEDGDRFVQLVVVPVHTEDDYVDSESELGETERGSNGFGSTGR